MSTFRIIALYKFVHLPDYVELRQPLQDFCIDNDILGTLLLAEEGLNGTVAGSKASIENLIQYLHDDERFHGLSLKESWSDEHPFLRMKVKLKKEIVTLGVAGVDPNKQVGTYVKPKDWNALISRDDVAVVDTRNEYEIEIGTFRGAINPETQSFREFPQWVGKNGALRDKSAVAMFCTGGIRCEKATSFLLEQGFKTVYHLEGGILKYLEEVDKSDSLWEGECFVFDDRVSVDHNLAPGSYDMCHGCRSPITDEDKDSPHFMQGVCCPRCHRELTDSQKARFSERQKQMELAAERQTRHLGRKG